MQYIKADANTEVLIGPVVAVGDGFTPVTTLSLSTADEAEIIKYGGATPLTVTSISANGFAAITGADGYYTLDISTANSDTEGFLTVLINDDSLCLPVRVDFMVVNANVYDSLFAAATTDYLQVDTVQLASTTQDATDLADFASAGYDPATNKVQGVVLVDTTTTNTDMRGTDSAATAAELAKVPKSDGTATWNATALASINAEADSAFTTYDPPTNTEMVAAFTEIKGATWAAGTDTLEHIRNKQTDIETDTQDLQTQVGTAGAGLTDLGGMSTAMKAEVNAELLDVIQTDTFAELAGVPAATSSLKDKLTWVFMLARNQIEQTATTTTVRADDTTTSVATSTVSDNGTTATRGEMT